MPELRLEDLSKAFGKTVAVDGVNLEIESGTFVSLLGPSGCGKTTTLSMIAGLQRPTSGRIVLDGLDITELPPNERAMGMVFQDYALYPNMTVRQNIGFNLRLAKVPREEIARRVDELADHLDIGVLLDRRPAQLSGGQQQRVALGRALVKDPAVLLLDEPLSNLDAGLRSRMRALIKRLHVRSAATSVFVTHDQEEAMTLSDRIAVMADGDVLQYGSPDEIYGRPASVQVAAFVGKPRMSLLEGSVAGADGNEVAVLLDGDAGRIDLERRGPRSADRLTIGVRAEDVRVAGPTTAATLTGRVALIEPIGSDTFVEVDCGAATITARTPPDQAPSVGDAVGLNVTNVHVFDTNTGRRLDDLGVGRAADPTLEAPSR